MRAARAALRAAALPQELATSSGPSVAIPRGSLESPDLVVCRGRPPSSGVALGHLCSWKVPGRPAGVQLPVLAVEPEPLCPGPELGAVGPPVPESGLNVLYKWLAVWRFQSFRIKNQT